MGIHDWVHKGTLTQRADGSLVFDIPEYQSIDERMGRVRSQSSIVPKQLEEHGHKITHIRGNVGLCTGCYELPLLRGFTGNLRIDDKAKFSAPNLTYITGNLQALGNHRDFDFQALESVIGNLTMKLSENPFPLLRRVVGHLEVTMNAPDKTVCRMPSLIMIGGTVFSSDIDDFAVERLHIEMPRLRVIGNPSSDLLHRIDHPELALIKRMGLWVESRNEEFWKWAKFYEEQDLQIADAIHQAERSTDEAHGHHLAL